MNSFKYIIPHCTTFNKKKLCINNIETNKLNENDKFFLKRINDKKEDEKRIPIVKFHMFSWHCTRILLYCKLTQCREQLLTS